MYEDKHLFNPYASNCVLSIIKLDISLMEAKVMLLGLTLYMTQNYQ